MEERHPVVGHAIAHNIETYVYDSKQVINSFTGLDYEDDIGALQEYFEREIKAYDNFDAFYFVSNAGTLQTLAPYDARYIGLDVSYQPYFMDTIENFEIHSPIIVKDKKGKRVAKKVYELDLNKKPKVILLTGAVLEETESMSDDDFNKYFDAYIEKPVEPEDLADKIKQLIT